MSSTTDSTKTVDTDVKSWTTENLSSLSNEALSARNTRLKLESEYSKLLTPDTDDDKK